MLWRQRRWRRLLNLIDHLPANSFMNQALVNDEAYARLVKAERKKLEASGQKADSSPSMATWSPEMNLLAVIVDKLSVLIEIQKTKPSRPVQYPRPKTAFDRLEVSEMREIHDRLTAALVPTT